MTEDPDSPSDAGGGADGDGSDSTAGDGSRSGSDPDGSDPGDPADREHSAGADRDDGDDRTDAGDGRADGADRVEGDGDDGDRWDPTDGSGDGGGGDGEGDLSGGEEDGGDDGHSAPDSGGSDRLPAPGGEWSVWSLVPRSRTGRAVAALTLLALAVRLAMLGGRTAHWDEGRVAFWTLRYARTGFFEYRPIVHGPFLFQVNSLLFRLFGPSDFVARLPVAVVGGLLPTTAWLFRDRLDGREVVALAALLTANPLLVYYSRFMRNDVLVAGFVLFALAFGVRAYDRRDGRYLYPAAVAFALAFTAKENALVYVLCLLGAGGLLFDHRMIGAVRGDAATSGDRVRAALLEHPLRAGAVLALLAANPVVLSLVGAGSTSAVVGLTVVAMAGYLGALRGANLWHYAAVLGFAGTLIARSTGVPDIDVVAWFALSWLLAAALVVDEWLYGPPGDDSLAVIGGDPDSGATDEGATDEGAGSTASPAADLGGRRPDWLPWAPPALVAYLLFLGTLVVFYAPRSPDPNALGLYNAVFDPTQFPAVVREALVGSWESLTGQWVNAERPALDVYRDRLHNMVDTMATTAGVLSVAAAVGIVVDRWGGDGPRDLVALAGYWGMVSVLGYPYATDIWAPWIAVHAVVPLAIPAAVGLARGYDALATVVDRRPAGDTVTPALAVAVVLLVAAPVAVTVVDVAYVNSDDHRRVLGDVLGQEPSETQYVMQWAQPSNDLKRALAPVDRIAPRHDGTDVLYYGTARTEGGTPHLYVPNESRCLRRPPVHEPVDVCRDPDLSWHSRLPVPWYLESYGATVDSVPPGEDLSNLSSLPPVVIGFGWDQRELRRQLPDRYEGGAHRSKLWGEEMVVFVDQTALPE